MGKVARKDLVGLTDEEWMKVAICEAKKAASKGETPIGAVIVKDGRFLACGRNRREEKDDVTEHAELAAIRKAGKAIGDWRLTGCTLYVTLEPCMMCAGAIASARVSRVVFGAWDHSAGAMGSACELPVLPLCPKPEILSGVLEEECRTLLQTFFRERRKKEKYKKNE